METQDCTSYPNRSQHRGQKLYLSQTKQVEWKHLFHILIISSFFTCLSLILCLNFLKGLKRIIIQRPRLKMCHHRFPLKTSCFLSPFCDSVTEDKGCWYILYIGAPNSYCGMGYAYGYCSVSHVAVWFCVWGVDLSTSPHPPLPSQREGDFEREIYWCRQQRRSRWQGAVSLLVHQKDKWTGAVGRGQASAIHLGCNYAQSWWHILLSYVPLRWDHDHRDELNNGHPFSNITWTSPSA